MVTAIRLLLVSVMLVSFFSFFFFRNDITSGFICRNKDQINNKKCNDYRVRFNCYPPFCERGGITTFCMWNIKLLMQTDFLLFFYCIKYRQSFKMLHWFCSFLTGMLCLYLLTAVCWTSWFNRDDPGTTGDWEVLSELKKHNKICDNPLYVDAVTTDTMTPAIYTEETFYM